MSARLLQLQCGPDEWKGAGFKNVGVRSDVPSTWAFAFLAVVTSPVYLKYI